jgi:cysteinyl-tRNA synthetase
VDLKFPHHEAEIAQAEGATGRAPLVNVWMHGGMLTFRGEKMSKSLGNVVSLSETLNVFAPEVLRFYYLNSQYRSPLEFVDGKSLEEAREAHERLFGPRRRLQEQLDRVGLDGPGRELAASLAEEASAVVGRMDDAMADDFNTRETIAILFQYVRSLAEPLAHLDALSGNALVQLDGPFQWAEEVLGLDTGIPRESLQGRWDPLVQAAIAARARARERGDFSEADRIRQELGRAGIQLEDDANGTRWRWEH